MTTIKLRECPFCGQTHLRYDDWVVCQNAHAVLTPGGVEHRKLSPSVLETLIALLLRRGRVSSARDLAPALWLEGEEPEYAHSVIQAHIRTLRARDVAHITGRQGWGWELHRG